MSRRLSGGMPRRFKDHRARVARPYSEAYRAITERYPPRDRLACRLTAIAADMLLEYERLRGPQKGRASARRKTVGLLLGALRAAREGMNGHGEPDVAAQLAALGPEAEQ